MPDGFTPVVLKNTKGVLFTAHTQEQLDSALRRKYEIALDQVIGQSHVDQTVSTREEKKTGFNTQEGITRRLG